MLRKIYYSKLLKQFLKIVFGLIYDKKYLRGKYFDEKRMGWLWALRGLKGRVLGVNAKIPWPVNPNTIVSNYYNIEFDVDDIHIFQTPGCYWQNHDAKIIIGRGCHVAPNVGLITTNHDINNISEHAKGKPIVLGERCWIGMNSVILPGVNLGNDTIVAAGAVVTKSFEGGNCVIGGVPAKIIKGLNHS